MSVHICFPRYWRGIFYLGGRMKIGYAYHLKDSFFALVNDPTLMSNKENGGYRPHYFCLEDEKRKGLYWAIPISSKIEKYRAIVNKKIERFGKCNTIVIASFAGRESAFLIQNMFPITEEYIDHIHTIAAVPVALHKSTQEVLSQNARSVLAIYKRNKRIIFSDIEGILLALGFSI